MDDAQVAGLKRKFAVTVEPAKRAEIKIALAMAGHDVDAPDEAPKARTQKPLVTAESSKPTGAKLNAIRGIESPDESAKRGPGRPRKTDAN